jgi:hypothetical protein
MFNLFKNWNWFRNYTVPPVIQPESPPKMTPIPPIPEVPANQYHDHYRVGYDNANELTTLTLHSDYTSMTLSLEPVDVLRLIRMLAATLDDDALEDSRDLDD